MSQERCAVKPGACKRPFSRRGLGAWPPSSHGGYVHYFPHVKNLKLPCRRPGSENSKPTTIPCRSLPPLRKYAGNSLPKAKARNPSLEWRRAGRRLSWCACRGGNPTARLCSCAARLATHMTAWKPCTPQAAFMGNVLFCDAQREFKPTLPPLPPAFMRAAVCPTFAACHITLRARQS